VDWHASLNRFSIANNSRSLQSKESRRFEVWWLGFGRRFAVKGTTDIGDGTEPGGGPRGHRLGLFEVLYPAICLAGVHEEVLGLGVTNSDIPEITYLGRGLGRPRCMA
jgi:hypothetical protein